MNIHHIAIWVKDLEKMKSFYLKYFDVSAGEKYINPIKYFSSYFIQFNDGCKIELMHQSDVPVNQNDKTKEYFGLAHFAIQVGSKSAVDELTERLKKDGYKIIGEPRMTGDGFYESVLLDPENNRIELTI